MNKLIYKILSCYLLKNSCIRKNIFLLIFFSYKFIYKTLFKYAIGGNFVKAYPKEAIFSHTFLFFKTLTFDLVDKKREERFLKNNVISHLHHIILIQIFTLNFLIFHPPHNQTRPKTRAWFFCLRNKHFINYNGNSALAFSTAVFPLWHTSMAYIITNQIVKLD